MPHHPLVELSHIGNGIHPAAGAQDKRILGHKTRRHDACLVLARFEVWIREAEEESAELATAEEIGEEFHGVGAYAGDVLIERGMGCLCAEGADAVLDKAGNLVADFEAWSRSVGTDSTRRTE